MSQTGYKFFVGEMELPYAPSELKVTIGSNNKTVQLINGTEINILKDPKLRDVEFKVELPRGRQYPFANKLVAPSRYIDYFNSLLANKTPTTLLIIRQVKNSSGRLIQDFEATDILVSLEDYSWSESAENAYDITVSLKFKEYIRYGTIKKTLVKTNADGSTNANTVSVETNTKPLSQNENYKIQSGDTLRKISKKFYGNGDKWETIYKANKTIIEDTARQHGKKSSSNGHWIYPGCELIIPGGDVKALKSNTNPDNKPSVKQYDTITIKTNYNSKYAGSVKISYTDKDGKSKECLVNNNTQHFQIKKDSHGGVTITVTSKSGYSYQLLSNTSKTFTLTASLPGGVDVYNIPRESGNLTFNLNWVR